MLKPLPRSRLAWLPLTVAGSLFLVGCGGGGGETDATTQDAARQSALATAPTDDQDVESTLAVPQAVTYLWTQIATEGQAFTVGTSQRVRYGAGAAWVKRTMSGAGQCSTAFFGSDPAPGVAKHCDLRSTVTEPPAETWTKIASEGGAFTVGTSQRVRYGFDTRWVERTLTGGGQCTNAFFGTDPAVGVTKQCDVLSSTPPPPPTGDYTAPIVISAGGTFSGNWESLDPKVAAVTVSTTQPVVIENCRIRGRGHLIQALLSGTNITVRNCVGQGLNPNVINVRTGRFLSVYKPAKLTVERNTMLGTAGIYADGAGTPASGMAIRYNLARNIEGRLSNGVGGYLTTFERMQFLQLNNVRGATGVEIAWNEVVNEPGKSRVEENINLYLSSGTAGSPIAIHDNYIQGAYGADPIATGYVGGGIIVDGGTTSLAAAAGWVRIYDNQIVGTQNQGIAIAAGHDVDVRNNRLIGSGLLPDGRRMTSANVGIYVWDSYGTPATFFNIVATANTVGWVNAAGKLNNYWFPHCTGTNCQGNTWLAGPITLAMEASEFTAWKNKLTARGITVGSTLTP